MTLSRREVVMMLTAMAVAQAAEAESGGTGCAGFTGATGAPDDAAARQGLSLG